MGASIQGSYGKPEKGFKGGVANSNPQTVDNGVAESDLGVGKFCTFGANGGFDVIAGASSVVAGVIVKSDALVGAVAPAGENVTNLRKGNVFVYCETACAKGNPVYVRHTVNGALEIGDVRNDVDGTNAAAVSATFAETLTAAGLVEIEVNL